MLKRKRSLLYDFIFIISLLIFTLTIFFAYRIHSVESRVLEQGLENVSGRINHHFVESVEYTENVLNYMGRQISRHNKTGDYNYTLGLFQTFAQDTKLTDALSWTLVSWVDVNNKLQVDARLGILGKDTKDVSMQPHILAAKERQWETKLAEARKGNTSGKWIIPAAIGVADINGSYIGSFIYGFDIEKMKQQFLSYTLGKNINFALIDANHNIVFSSQDNFVIDNKVISSFDFNVAQPQKYSHINLFSGASSFVYKFDKYPYAIYLTYGDGILLTELGKALRENTFEILLAFLILAIMGFYFSKRIVLPIKELSNAAKLLSRNIDNAKIPSPSSSELFALAAALTRMKVYKRRDRRAKEAVDTAYAALEEETLKLNKSNAELETSHNELKQANERIAELISIHKASDKEKESFLRDMYHALNTPLNAIINGADIARKEVLGPLNLATYKDYLDAMYDAGMQLKCFTTEFIYPEPVDVRDIIQKCVTIQRKYASDHEIELVANISDNIPNILVDKLRFRQVILSTLYHSMYHVAKGGKTEISTDVEYNVDGSPLGLTISIKDNGWGHDEQMREKMWEDKFGNETDSYSRNPDMMKLSLNTLKYFMTLHKGIFSLQTIADTGSIFTIYIPYQEKDTITVKPTEIISTAKSKKSKDPKTKSKTNILHFPKKQT